jgi:hypothetical protein
MANFPLHFGFQYRNKTLDWMATDSEQRYQELVKKTECREYFAEQGWDQPGAITYKLNSYGFRADEFDGGPYLVALGCSFTVGIGIPESQT